MLWGIWGKSGKNVRGPKKTSPKKTIIKALKKKKATKKLTICLKRLTILTVRIGSG